MVFYGRDRKYVEAKAGRSPYEHWIHEGGWDFEGEWYYDGPVPEKVPYLLTWVRRLQEQEEDTLRNALLKVGSLFGDPGPSISIGLLACDSL